VRGGDGDGSGDLEATGGPVGRGEGAVHPFDPLTQAEQAAPGAGQSGVPASSEVARRQVADLVATAPPEIAGDWRTVQSLTDQALASLAATGGDPSRIDHATLDRLQRDSQPRGKKAGK